MSIRIVLAAVLTAIVFVATGGVASAKGPLAATIDGPGLSDPLRVTPSNGGLYQLVERTGLYVTLSSTASDTVDDRLLDAAPAGVLGPHYLVVYELPGGAENILVEQYLYPWADGGPVASTLPNLAYGGTDGTERTWIRAGADVSGILTTLGVPVPSDLAAAVAADGTQNEVNEVAHDETPDGLGLPAVVGIVGGGALGLVAVGVAAATAVRRYRGPARSLPLYDDGQTRVTAATEQV